MEISPWLSAIGLVAALTACAKTPTADPGGNLSESPVQVQAVAAESDEPQANEAQANVQQPAAPAQQEASGKMIKGDEKKDEKAAPAKRRGPDDKGPVLPSPIEFPAEVDPPRPEVGNKIPG